MSAVSGESLRRPRARPPSSTDLHFPFLEQRLQGGVRGGFEFLLVEERIPDRPVLLPQQGPRLPGLRPLRALDREDPLPHLDDLRVDLVGFAARGEERFVLLVPIVNQGGDLMDDADGLLVAERAFSLSATAASCSFSAASKNSVIPESMSLISFAILSWSALRVSSCLTRFIDRLSSTSNSFSALNVREAVCCRISIWETRRFRERSSVPTSAVPEPRSFRFISIRAFAFAWRSSRFSRCLRASPANEARRSLRARSFAPISRFFSWTRSRSCRRSCASWFRASRFSKRLWSLISA